MISPNNICLLIAGCPQVRYAVSAETTEPAADQPHPGDAARPEGQAAAADAGPREGGGAVQVLQARRSQHQDQGHAPVSTYQDTQVDNGMLQ